jgi:hypothetical protein
MNSENLRLFYEPEERLRLTVAEEKSYLTVKPVWAKAGAQAQPDGYLALLDGQNDEIVSLIDSSTLPHESQLALRRELRQRYLPATVKSINHARQSHGAVYWDVETDRGPREFVTQRSQKSRLSYSNHHILLIAVDGNRFEIPDVEALDARSRAVIHAVW